MEHQKILKESKYTTQCGSPAKIKKSYRLFL